MRHRRHFGKEVLMEVALSARSNPNQKRRRSRYVSPVDVQEVDHADGLPWLSVSEKLFAPARIWAAGDLELLRSGRRVAIVGSRKVSEFGARRAKKVAKQLAERGVTVVSGLAQGVDHAAHEGAIVDGEGRTIAVIGTPLERCYPADHAELQQVIYENHLLLSQFAPGGRTFPSHFIERNRFMALICQASVIVEAGDSSGTLSQAAETQRLGRPLFIMRSVLDNKALAWPEKFLHPKSGGPALVLDDVQQIMDVLPA